jgi:hypothetical protein
MAKASEAKSMEEIPMRRLVTLNLAAATAAGTLALGVGSASAATKFTCTRTAHHHTVQVTVRSDRAEDALEAHGFRCSAG